MVIFCGAALEADLGKVTVRTPSSIEALTASFCSKKIPWSASRMPFTRVETTYIYVLRKRQGSRELATVTLAEDIAVPGAFGIGLALARDGQHIIVHVDLHVLFLEAGKLECGGDGVHLFVLVDIEPRMDPSVFLCRQNELTGGTHFGQIGRDAASVLPWAVCCL